jgi:hypothetical protein
MSRLQHYDTATLATIGNAMIPHLQTGAALPQNMSNLARAMAEMVTGQAVQQAEAQLQQQGLEAGSGAAAAAAAASGPPAAAQLFEPCLVAMVEPFLARLPECQPQNLSGGWPGGCGCSVAVGAW